MNSHMIYELPGRELKKRDRIAAGEKYEQLEICLMNLVDWPECFFDDGLTCCDFTERYITGTLTNENHPDL